MGTKRNLTIEEKAKIDFLAAKNYAAVDIAATIKRITSAVRDFLRHRNQKIKKKSLGRPAILILRAIRILVNIARRGKITARKVLEASGMQVSLRTVQRILQQHERMMFGNLKNVQL